MRRSSFVLAVLILLLASASAGARQAVGSRSVILTGAAAREIFRQGSRASPENVDGYYTPTLQQVRVLERRLPAYLKAQSRVYLKSGRMPPSVRPDDFVVYYHQCAGFVRRGRKMIYVNAFSPRTKRDLVEDVKYGIPFTDWKREAVTMNDGGHHYFGVEYDVETKQFDHLSFNGPG